MSLESSEPSAISVTIPQLLLVGTGAGAGVSTIMMGLLVALKRAGVATSTAKIGPSLTDPTFHRRIAGRLSHTLDFWMLSRRALSESLARASGGSDLLIIEGDTGVFDRYDDDHAFPTAADFCSSLGVPVVLVADAQGYSDSFAALIKGFISFHPNVHVAGVIANRVIDAAHHQRLRAAVESVHGPVFLGGVPLADPQVVSPSKTGASAGNPSLFTRNRLIAVGDLVQGAINLNALREVASKAMPLVVAANVLESASRRCRIAIADDAAFHVTVQDNLDLIRRSGAELVAFSPLADLKLPHKAGGIYLPGGYIHLYAADLCANQAMIKAIREFISSGGVLYAEGGAVAYLSRKMTLYSGENYDMVGILPASSTAAIEEMQQVDNVYCDITSSEETIVSRTGQQVRGFRDPRWLVRLERPVVTCYRVRERGKAGDAHMTEGLSPNPNVLMSTIKTHWASSPEMARIFVDAVSASLPTLQAFGETPARV